MTTRTDVVDLLLGEKKTTVKADGSKNSVVPGTTTTSMAEEEIAGMVVIEIEMDIVEIGEEAERNEEEIAGPSKEETTTAIMIDGTEIIVIEIIEDVAERQKIRRLKLT